MKPLKYWHLGGALPGAVPKCEMTQSIFNTNQYGHKTHGYDKFPGSG